MGREDQTWMSEFILLGLSSCWETQVSLFVLFLAMYLMTVLGNFLIILLIRLDSRLNTPMYVFLSILSFVDICYINITVPQTLIHFLLVAQESIPFYSCVLQLFISLAMSSTEFFLLEAMAYDRCVAVCRPLHCAVTMHGGLCLGLAAGCLLAGFMNSLMQTVIFQLPLCHKVVHHFACEMLAVLRLTCVDISFNKVMVAISGFLVIMLPCFLVLFSYGRIVAAILCLHSAQGRHKAFGTCASHLIVVSMCFGTAIFTYLRPMAGSSAEQEKMVTLFFAVVTPMLNPLIYSLNKEVMSTSRRVLGKLSDKG
ncbi:LOW QUALITY PROTEIN: olfactory receptor-like protein OLF3 [Sagmatias obliquidens]|uniref:LOW QUALITY PROTEIN: olfactory receptor-like protein OLF3 n=1 Tax=Sagmatias obliquidens TaxID=3371155 RepID=UPI000F44557C|nr:LOW QUALITY PROTEIN: olfactory receptor-like protein OLF3 [Lagenorhynchus obliquidens]